jgi:hypothetical protein
MEENNYSKEEIEVFKKYNIDYKNLSPNEIEKQLKIIYYNYSNNIKKRINNIIQTLSYLDN